MYWRGAEEFAAMRIRIIRIIDISVMLMMMTMTKTKQLFVFPSTGEVRRTCGFPTEKILPG